jgi:hypothetical protein
VAISDFFLRFKNEIETSENHSDVQLKTHYYKGNSQQLFLSVEQIFRLDADCQITTISKEHGEIAIEVKKPFPCFLIVSIISVKPLETAVDFTISTDRKSFFGNYPILKSRIISYYERMNTVHTLIKAGTK